MSEPETPDNELSADDIIGWLRANPSFLQKHPEACDLLIPPKQHEGRKVADFQNFMIQRLKADKEDVLTSTRELVENARNNMNNQARIHRAVLRLLEADTFEEFIHVVTSDLAVMLDVDISSLVIEADSQTIPNIAQNNIRIVPEGTLDKWMEGKHVNLHSNITGIEAIYGPGALLVRSQALVRVDIAGTTPPTLVAFGARDPDMFQDGQGTEMVSFLARVIERLFRSWLYLPQ